MANLIAVKHNIEVAHRLFELEGKCENIHGHSMWITLWLKGDINEKGILDGIEFGELKKDFRGFLDTDLDHHLLLNEDDPWAGTFDTPYPNATLPGLRTCSGDPTTENISCWIAQAMKDFGYNVHAVDVWETSVNMARWKSDE